MQLQDAQEVETTINELISALKETTGDNTSAAQLREMHILAAYMLSGLFGSGGFCSRSWH
jgi:hypothetical protein